MPILWKSLGIVENSWFSIKDYVILEGDIPGIFNQYNELGVEWDTIKEAVPEAVDAVTSPGNDVLIVQTDKELKVFLNPLQGINIPSLTLPCSSNEKFVLNQWVTGKNEVNKWNENISK